MTDQSGRASFDTNILIYSIDLRDPAKHLRAKEVLRLCHRVQSPVLLQVLNEFYRAATRKGLLAPGEAASVVHATRCSGQVIAPTEEDMLAAMEVHKRHQIQFFDALLWATAERAGCTLLFSEDGDDGRKIGRVRVVNPFRLSIGELTDSF